MRQASSFIDETTSSWSPDLDADRDALADLIRRLRSVDPVQTLDSLLQELRLGGIPCCTARPSRSPWGGCCAGHSVALDSIESRFCQHGSLPYRIVSTRPASKRSSNVPMAGGRKSWRAGRG